MLHDSQALIDRLVHAAQTKQRPVVFLVGAPISAPRSPTDKGVPDVKGMIGLMRVALGQDSSLLDSFDKEVAKENGHEYQNAFNFLIARRGQDAANAIVRSAVLASRIEPVGEAFSPDEPHLKELDEDSEGWHLPDAVSALSSLVSSSPDVFGRVVLTSNFDPLIEVGIRRNEGRFFRTVLHRDGNLGQSQSDGCHVVHLHGYWYGYDTLHTQRQLNQNRPQLSNSLRRLLHSSTIVVMGYGGWDDIFTKALMEVVNDDGAYPEVIWTFRSTDLDDVQSRYKALLERLGPGMDRGRVTLYGGIDCHDFLPELVKIVRLSQPGKEIRIAPGVTSTILETNSPSDGSGRIEIKIVIPDKPLHQQSLGDTPPHVDIWVGRAKELNELKSASYKVAAISGIGGQGKSALAAVALKDAFEGGSIDFWSWRDCREQGDRIHTQLVSIIEGLSRGSVPAESIEDIELSNVVEVFFNVLGQRRCVFVFDNVDHYIDLESYAPLGGLAVLFEAVIRRQHESKFIFTCRPPIRHENSNVLSLSLEGLGIGDVRELFNKRGIRTINDDLVQDLYELTNGHPLWTNIIVVQTSRVTGGLRQVVTDIRRGRGTLPENTLRSIWQTLNDSQRDVLRTVAEFEKPEPEDQLADIVTIINWNRLSKAVKTLKSFNLLVVKYQTSGPDLVELHPMIREFIRKEFPRKEREKYINTILIFLDRMIGRYKPSLSAAPSKSILDYWIHKIELQINLGAHESALETLDEVDSPLIDRGFPEEFVRVGKKLLDSVNWGDACVSSKYFDTSISKISKVMTEFGQNLEVDQYLKRYEESIPGKSAQFINLCDMRTYSLWYQRNFQEAIYWGERGESLRTSTSVDTKFSVEHNLALARRDSGRIEEALAYFLRGSKIEEVANDRDPEPNKKGAFYGNIGRCLYFQGDMHRALLCYRKSARALDKDKDSLLVLNRGYIRHWVGMSWEKVGMLKEAYAAYRAASEIWNACSPPRAREADAAAQSLLASTAGLSNLENLESWRFEALFLSWVNTGRVDEEALSD